MPFNKTRLVQIATGAAIALGTAATPILADGHASIKVLKPAELDRVPLNPARGVASPLARVLWGDIREDVPSGIVLGFADGFASPPHIHNITYRAVVISGEMHNDDPNAENLWMGPGSYWKQPAGEVHITSARPGSGGAVAFLEILEGPYLVQPGDQAFDNGERPVNVTDDIFVWLGADEMSWLDVADTDESPEIAMLWGATDIGTPTASMLKLPPNATANVTSEGDVLRSVVIKGNIEHQVVDATEPTVLTAGGYFSSDASIAHQVSCTADEECLVYLRTDGRFVVN